MFCEKCGTQIPEGSKFCPKCGVPADQEESPVTEAPVSETPEAEPPVTEAPATEAPVVEAPAAVAVAEPEGEEAPVPTKKKKKAGKIVAIVLLCVAAVGLVAAAAVLLFRVFLGGGGSDRVPAYAYLTGDNELMYLSDLKEKTQALEATDEWQENYRWNGYVQFSKDGKTVYFTSAEDEDAEHLDLYRATVAEMKKGEGADRIVRDVDGFFVLDNETVFFWTYDEDYNMTLGIFDGEEDDTLVKNCGDFTVSEDEKSVYYTDADKGTLYRYDLASGEEEELVDEADRFLTPLDAETLVYTVSEGIGYNLLTVYACKPGQEPEELASGVQNAYAEVTDGKVRVDYVTQQAREATLYDFVNDPGDADLAGITEPDYSDYDLWDVYYMDGKWYYEDYADDVWHDLDVSSLLTGGRTPADLAYYEVWDLAYDQLDEAYSAAYEAWQTASQREELRQDLKDMNYTVTSYDLYRYEDGKSELVATNMADYDLSGERVQIYHKVPGDEKVIDLADLDLYDYYSDYYSQVMEKLEDRQWYQNINGVENPLDLGEDVSNVSIYTLGDSEVLLNTYGNDHSSLRAYTIKDNKLELSETLSDTGASAMQVRENEQGDKAFYYLADGHYDEDSEAYIGDLVRYQNGKQETLVKGVGNVYAAPKGETFYLVVPTDSDAGELVRLRDGKADTVAKDYGLNGGTFAPCGEDVLYIDKDGRLYVWDGKESRRLAKDAKNVWANTDEYYYPIY